MFSVVEIGIQINLTSLVCVHSPTKTRDSRMKIVVQCKQNI